MTAPHCPGTGQRTLRPFRASGIEPDRCPVCYRAVYVRVDGTTGSHHPTVAARRRIAKDYA